MHKNYVWQIWKWFILFIMIPVLLLNFAIGYLFFNIRKSMESGAVSQMEHSQFLLNEMMDELAVSIQKIGKHPLVFQCAQMEKGFGSEGYRNLMEVKDSIYRYGGVSTDQYSVGILFNKNDALITGNSICVDMEKFYGGAFKVGELPYESLKHQGFQAVGIRCYPDSEIVMSGEKRRGLFYTTALSEYASENSGATALVSIYEDELDNLFRYFIDQGGLIYIGDVEGNILYESGNREISSKPVSDVRISDNVEVLPDSYYGNNMYVLRAQLRSGLYAGLVIPKHLLYIGSNNLLIFVFILNITTVFMCLLLVMMAVSGTRKRMKNIWDVLPEKTDRRENILTLVDDAVGSLRDTNRNLESQLGEQHIYLQTVFWNKVLNVNTLSDEEVKKLAGRAGIKLESSAYCMLLAGFRYDGIEEYDDWRGDLDEKERILQALEKQASDCGFICSRGFSQLVILAGLSEGEINGYHQVIESKLLILSELTRQNSELFCIGSRIFIHVSEIFPVYETCRSNFNLSFRAYEGEQRIDWCEDNEINAEDTFYYTDEMKQQITAWIKSGQKLQTKNGFMNILDENYIRRTISPEMEKLLISKLKLTLVSAYDKRMELDLQKELDLIDTLQKDAVLFSHIWRVALSMCEFYNQNIQKHEAGLQKKIQDYIDEHFREYEFGLNAVAEHCHLSESYFSQIFKEIMGEKFSDYLEKKRMGYAKKLLLETDWTVERIGMETGYSNTNAFRKAYKRYFGVSPAQGRKEQKGQ